MSQMVLKKRIIYSREVSMGRPNVDLLVLEPDLVITVFLYDTLKRI